MFVSAFKQLWCWLCLFSEPRSRISPSSSSALLKLKVIDWVSVSSDLLYHHCLGPSAWAFSINLCVFRCSLFCLSGLDSAVSSLSEVRFFIFEGVSAKGNKSKIKFFLLLLFCFVFWVYKRWLKCNATASWFLTSVRSHPYLSKVIKYEPFFVKSCHNFCVKSE